MVVDCRIDHDYQDYRTHKKGEPKYQSEHRGEQPGVYGVPGGFVTRPNGI